MNTFKLVTGCILSFTLAAPIVEAAQEPEIVEHTLLMDHGDGHLMDMDGAMVMGQNKDKLPGGCSRISEEKEITVRAGHKYAKKFPGTMFAFDQQEFHFRTVDHDQGRNRLFVAHCLDQARFAAV